MIGSMLGKVMALITVLCLTVSGVFAAWTFLGPALDTSNDVSSSLSGFSYGPFYITKVEVVGGDYSSADVKKVSDTNISADISLNKNTSSTVVADITFYNSTDASYYYNEEQIVSTDNDKISCTVTGAGIDIVWEKQDDGTFTGNVTAAQIKEVLTLGGSFELDTHAKWTAFHALEKNITITAQFSQK